MEGTLPFDFSSLPDPNEGRNKINEALAFDPFYGSPTTVTNPTSQMHPKEYDEIIGLSWMAERLFGREAAARFLIEHGITPFPETR